MIKTKSNFTLLGFALILLLIIIAIAIVAFSSHPLTQQSSVPTPTPGTSEKRTNPPVLYNPDDQAKLLDKVTHRQTLSEDDDAAKGKILNLLPPGEKSGVVYQSPNVRIEYVSSADLFQAEITTTNIEQAKAEANVWFRSHGMSQEGLCNLPLQFYLNWDVANQLRGKGVIFNPLPNGC